MELTGHMLSSQKLGDMDQTFRKCPCDPGGVTQLLRDPISLLVQTIYYMLHTIYSFLRSIVIVKLKETHAFTYIHIHKPQSAIQELSLTTKSFKIETERFFNK